MTVKIRDNLVEKLLAGEILPEDIHFLEKKFDKISFFDFRPAVHRIFDQNNGLTINQSEAQMGVLGKLNRRAIRIKNRKFLRKITRKNTDKIIVAEGDSWFEYPVFISDIVDWIIKKSNHAVYSIAAGGDWIANILYSGKYITDLSLYRPDVFLISGGGNDLVGNRRLANLVKNRSEVNLVLNENDELLSNAYQDQGIEESIARKLVVGRKFLNKDFWALLNIFRFQYYLIFKSIRSNPRFKNMKIITQGYDYPIPSSNRSFFGHPIRWLMKNGKWLDIPLKIRGIHNGEEQQAILTIMIHEFNNMLIDVGNKFDKIYHIDCRGLASEGCWFDELHLKSRYYRIIAKTYLECIDSVDDEKRVYNVS